MFGDTLEYKGKARTFFLRFYFKVEVMTDKSNESPVSFVHVANEGEAHSKYWVAILVQMNTEKKVGEKLSALGIVNYVPVQTEMHQWSDRRKKIERVVIPMVVFVMVDSNSEKLLRTYSYVRKILSYPGRRDSAKIPERQIELLRFMLENADAPVSVMNSIQVGDEVRVASGPLRGLVGVVSETDEKNLIVGVQIDALGYACVKISKNHLAVC